MRAPIGAAGELYIGGAGVTRGYWRRPDLTAEKFSSNPFETDRSEMMYRTGDLARYRDDGEIEFIGRTDQQVKIRGFRIELGEIETVLGAHPAVQEAVVVSYRDRAGQQQLAAHVVLKHGPAVSRAGTEDSRAEEIAGIHDSPVYQISERDTAHSQWKDRPQGFTRSEL